MQRLHQEFRDVQDTGEKHALSSLLLHFFCFFYFPNIIHLHVGDSGGNNLRKTSKKNSISLLSFLSAASSLIPVVFLFLFTKRMILFSIFFSFPSRRVQRGVIKQAPFFFSPFLLWSAGGIFLGFFFERRRTSSFLSGRPKLARLTF